MSMSKRSKEKKIKKLNSYSSDSDEMMRMVKVLGGVLVCLGLFYLIFAIATGEISFGKKDEKKADEIQNQEILAGTIFSRVEADYYVLMYDFSRSDAIVYENIYDLSSYGVSEKVFLVDLGKKFNSSYVIEDKSKVNISDIKNLKVVNGTLVKVVGGKGSAYFVGEENIKKELFK